MARKQTGPEVKRRPSRGRETQVAQFAKPTGLAERLERAARSGQIPKPMSVISPRTNVHIDGLTDDESPSDVVYREGLARIRRPRQELPELPPFDPANYHPDDLKNALSQSLWAIEVGDTDLDALWDAVRADKEGAKRFLGVVPETSVAMRAICQMFRPHFYVLVDDTPAEGKVRVGFVGFQELRVGQDMMAHIFLVPEARGEGPRLIPQLMSMANDRYPGYSFVVSTGDYAMARMLAGCGFTAEYLLKYTPLAEVPAVDPADAPEGDLPIVETPLETELGDEIPEIEEP